MRRYCHWNSRHADWGDISDRVHRVKVALVSMTISMLGFFTIVLTTDVLAIVLDIRTWFMINVLSTCYAGVRA